MARFRKRSVEITATQWQGDPVHQGVFFSENTPFVLTLSGPVPIEIGDWLIPEPGPGMFYPCKPAVFAERYEAIEP